MELKAISQKRFNFIIIHSHFWQLLAMTHATESEKEQQ
jgi:hypothetical protein